VGELVFLIPILGILTGMLGIWTKHQHQMANLRQTDMSDSVADHYAAQNQQLEDRVRVLERIVTDKGYDVATQIEALRDARRTEALLDQREPEVRS
jgi:hypothetical protein